MNMATKTPGKTREYKHCGQLFDQLSACKEHERPSLRREFVHMQVL